MRLRISVYVNQFDIMYMENGGVSLRSWSSGIADCITQSQRRMDRAYGLPCHRLEGIMGTDY